MVMGFNFRLDKVLKYRSGLEEQAQLELKRRDLLVESASLHLERLREEQDYTYSFMRAQTEKEIDITYLGYTYNYLSDLGNRIDEGVNEKNKKIKIADEQRTVLKKCWQDRRVMEIIQDKCYEEFREEEIKKERSNSDELALNAFVRNRRHDLSS